MTQAHPPADRVQCAGSPGQPVGQPRRSTPATGTGSRPVAAASPVSTSTRAAIAPGVVPYVAIRTGASEPPGRTACRWRPRPPRRPGRRRSRRTPRWWRRRAAGPRRPASPPARRGAAARPRASGRAAAGGRGPTPARPRSGRSRPEARRAGAERGTSTSRPAARAAPPKAATASASPLGDDRAVDQGAAARPGGDGHGGRGQRARGAAGRADGGAGAAAGVLEQGDLAGGGLQQPGRGTGRRSGRRGRSRLRAAAGSVGISSTSLPAASARTATRRRCGRP